MKDLLSKEHYCWKIHTLLSVGFCWGGGALVYTSVMYLKSEFRVSRLA